MNKWKQVEDKEVFCDKLTKLTEEHGTKGVKVSYVGTRVIYSVQGKQLLCELRGKDGGGREGVLYLECK